MIVQCPRCTTRYRYQPGQTSRNPARLRCRKCGSGFTVESSQEATSSGESSADETSPSSVRTALLADEPREFRRMVRSVLEEAGYEVSVTESGEEALLLAGSHRFDLILLNVYLRKMLGVTVCERIRSTPELREVRLLLIGTFLRGAEDGRLQARLYGADGFLETSLTREEIASRIAQPARAHREGKVLPPPSGPEPEPTGLSDAVEIRRLAQIMISDIQIYHPEKFKRAVRDGTFFEAFAPEIERGKELIHDRFGHVPDRIRRLFSAFRELLSLARESSPSAGSASI